MNAPNLLTLTPMLAPLGLLAVALAALAQPGRQPTRILAASRAAALFALALAVGGAGVVAALGPMSSPVLGWGGVGFGVRLDPLSAVMFLLVAFVGVVVIQYSRRYLDGDARHGLFLGRLSATLAGVMLLVLSKDIVQLVVAWVGTSLALQALLLFYSERPRARAAARKKFVVARIGDVCVVVAAALLVRTFGTTDLEALGAAARALAAGAGVPLELHLAAGLLVVAALFKSAQFPTHGWLLEVMETPTPVSALLHAGIINAGGFLVLRFVDVVAASVPALVLLAAVGGATALIASVVMLTQTSVKVSLAYSTVAQMGFMLFECGIGAHGIAVVHIVAHSLYKAHAFLSSGSVIDLRRASWVAPKVPRARVATSIGGLVGAAVIFVAVGLALGVPLFAQPALLTLGGILVLGLSLLLAASADGGPSAAVFARVGLGATATALAYYGLELGSTWLMAPTLPATPHTAAPLVAVMVMVLIGFALVTIAQLLGMQGWSGAYVHLRNGLYAQAAFNRLVGGLTRGVPSPAPAPRPRPGVDALTDEAVREAVQTVAGRIAPVWPLERFVAVNPFLGVADLDFADAAQAMGRAAGARLTMPRAFYAEALASGRMTERDLAQALREAPPTPGLPRDVAALQAELQREVRPITADLTVADVAMTLTGQDWPELVTDRISAWAAAYFDQGQASWQSPGRGEPPYRAWRREAAVDRTPEVMGLPGCRALVRDLPEAPEEVIALALGELQVSEAELQPYLHRLLMSVGGWAAYARYEGWSAELAGRRETYLDELLAIRIAWDLVLARALAAHGVMAAWSGRSPRTWSPERRAELATDVVLQAAYEKAWQRQNLIEAKVAAPEKPTTPWAHAVFCIDVRSEVIRRALERAEPDLATMGFAGFFGLPLDYVPFGHTHGRPQCPVLLEPKVTVHERPTEVDASTEASMRAARTTRRRIARARKAFKLRAVSSFGFVETLGLGFAVKLVTDSLGWSRTVPHPAEDGLDPAFAARLGPDERGLELETRIDSAASMLNSMSLTQGFGRLVVLVGHGATTVNNPHGAGLECGACGGHSGEANARLGARILNDREVRRGLEARGVRVPEHTLFLAALHDTTTDEVRIFDEALVPRTHLEDLARLKRRLTEAGRLAGAERALRLALPAGVDAGSALAAKSRDWSEVRPEWGLAGCAAFIVAPRSRTLHRDLEGRAFLHSYAWQQDEGFKTLELIMTAPMVVASWISLQYYGSSVDNRVFGSGNKALHNVTGLLGVLEGHTGDLRTGLSWQSVHDGERLIHEPVRLSVAIEAPLEAMSAVIERHAGVKALLDNGWIHLFALDAAGAVRHRYVPRRGWESALQVDLPRVA
ncbi:MAG: DUF2309 family protein [Myxococcales bacterium]|nr:DUF2309 family protein [Myxococcales bacterium]